VRKTPAMALGISASARTSLARVSSTLALFSVASALQPGAASRFVGIPAAGSGSLRLPGSGGGRRYATQGFAPPAACGSRGLRINITSGTIDGGWSDFSQTTTVPLDEYLGLRSRATEAVYLSSLGGVDSSRSPESNESPVYA
jgi:hypothetical protein